MAHLYSIRTGYQYSIGQVVELDEDLREGDRIQWVAIRALDPLLKVVSVSNGHSLQWVAPERLGATFDKPKAKSKLKFVKETDFGVPASNFKPLRMTSTPIHTTLGYSFTVNGPTLDAIIAGLHLLKREVEAGNVKFSDDDLIGRAWTCEGEHDGLTPAQIEQVIKQLCAQEVSK